MKRNYIVGLTIVIASIIIIAGTSFILLNFQEEEKITLDVGDFIKYHVFRTDPNGTKYFEYNMTFEIISVNETSAYTKGTYDNMNGSIFLNMTIDTFFTINTDGFNNNGKESVQLECGERTASYYSLEGWDVWKINGIIVMEITENSSYTETQVIIASNIDHFIY